MADAYTQEADATTLSRGEGAPTDEEIVAYSRAIQDSATQDTELVGPRVPIASLLSAYTGPENTLVRRKIRGLARLTATTTGTTTTTTTGTTFRRTRGDGNCFYRAVAFALLDAAGGNLVLADRLRSRASEFSNAVLDGAGFSPIVYEDFRDVFLQLLTPNHHHHHGQTTPGRHDDRSTTESRLWTAMRDDETSNAVVVYLRFLTSAWLKTHRDTYAPYLEEGQVLERWCERWVEAIGAEADNIQISALVNALDIGVDVVQLDHAETGQHPDAPRDDDDAAGGGGGGEVEEEESPYKAAILQVRPDSEDGVMAVVKVLYRPGHYDVLY